MYLKGDYLQRAKLFAHNRLQPSRPHLATLMLYATDLCDSACKHCLIWAKRPVQHLPKDVILKVMESRAVRSTTKVGLEGGEFLLHPEAHEILDWFSRHHPNFDLLSNCLKPEGTIEAVRRTPPRRLMVSLDGTAETYRSMRGKAGYDSVLQVIEACKDHVPVSVMFTLSPYNDFDDLRHVAEVCKRYGADLRVGIYNNINFFDTIDQAHHTEIGALKHTDDLRLRQVPDRRNEAAKPDGVTPADVDAEAHRRWTERLPEQLEWFAENYDFVLLYDYWRRGELKMPCRSIVDSLVVLPDGTVPICQHLDVHLGNVHTERLDDILARPDTRQQIDHYVHNCNRCWVNFHRKYDLIFYRSLERFFPKWAVSKLFGYYQWSADPSASLADLRRQAKAQRAEAVRQAAFLQQVDQVATPNLPIDGGKKPEASKPQLLANELDTASNKR